MICGSVVCVILSVDVFVSMFDFLVIVFGRLLLVFVWKKCVGGIC